MTRKSILIVILIVGLLASLFVAAQRVKVESRNKAVELVVDYAEIAQIVAATGRSEMDVLRSLKQNGVTGVAVTEQTIRDLVESGAVRPVHHIVRYVSVTLELLREVVRKEGVRALRIEELSCSPDVDCDVVGHLRSVLGPKHVFGGTPEARLYHPGPFEIRLHPQLPFQYIEQLPVGMSGDAVRNVQLAGLQLIARLVNYPGATPRAIDSILADVKSKGIDKIIFQGDQVLGFKGAVKETAESFRKHGLIFGQVEFAKQKGETELAERSQANVIPVHSITQNEMPTLTEGAIVDRFQKAVRERGVRICYVRMYDTASADLLRANCDYVRAIARAITAAGYTLSSAHPLEEVCAPAPTRILAGAGVAAGAVLLLLAIVDVSAVSGILWIAGAIIVCLPLAAAGDMGRKAVALLAAFVFPTLAALWATRGSPESPTESPRLLLRALGRLVGAIGITVAGGVLIVGLLSSRAFMLRIDQFMGIKVAHLVPVLLLAGLFAGGLAWKSDTWAAQKQRLGESFRKLLESPILMWQAIGLVAVLLLIGLMVARSGNDAGLEVSSIELKFRSILDKVMAVRPRTKEFLIGYPALLVGIAFALRGQRRWAAILVTVGSIGLVSGLNTFCHIHTPLAVSALRTVNGVVLGVLVGLIAYWLLRKHTHQGIM